MKPNPPEKAIFERIDHRPFHPRVWRADGRITVTRGGIALHPRWFWRTIYHRLWPALRVSLIAIASIIKRGARPIPPASNVGIIHSVWSAGYYHWLTESLPRALVLQERCPTAVPLLPKEHYSKLADSLLLLGLDRVEWFPEDSNAVIDRPLITECPPIFATTDRSLLRAVRRRIRGNLEGEIDRKASRVVYVSRKKSRGRRVRNEDRVVEMLTRHHATIVCFEDLDFEAQVRLMMHADLLVSIHGAGLTNMMWMAEGSSVIEILPIRHGIFDWNPVRRSFRHDACYNRLAEAMGLRYRYLQGRAHIAKYRRTWNADVTVDVDALETQIVNALQ